ncbi:FixH family protein [Paenibacillus caui]|uniref:FixH family protein n=1 Tax=Paenibacillus caui TaxID=2873927 RepID=UPI001CA9D08C|nr:FixH family protein [Paenibacillus caui]
MKLPSWIHALLLVVVLLMISACSAANPSEQPGAKTAAADAAKAEEGDQLQIVVSTSPDNVTVNSPVNLTAKVSKESQPVTDATVQFEIWKAGGNPDEHLQAAASFDKKDSYVLRGTFAEKGSYYVIVHVTPKNAARMQMASGQFEVK